MDVKVIEISQNNFKFYVCSLNAKMLYNMTHDSMEELKNNKDIYQRNLDSSRTKKIKEYADRERALFPTAVVLNSRQKVKFSEEKSSISIEDGDKFFIIDGQHRINGINDSNKEYELCVVIMDELDPDMQSELFITINSEQKKVNSNISFIMRANDEVETPEKFIVNVIKMLNYDKTSPLFERIWMDDRRKVGGKNMISLATFGSPLCNYIYNMQYYEFKEKLIANKGNKMCEEIINYANSTEISNKLLWRLYVNNKTQLLFKILHNYFSAIHEVYNEVWEDNSSVIFKTTGFNAFVMLFKNIFMLCKKDNDFTKDKIKELIEKNKLENCEFYTPTKYNVVNNGTLLLGRAQNGKAGSVELYKKLKKNMPENYDDEYQDLDYYYDDEIQI